jgi:hypothetical protein
MLPKTITFALQGRCDEMKPRWLLIVCLSFVLLLLVLDFFFLERRTGVERSVGQAEQQESYTGSVVLSEIAYHQRTELATAKLQLVVRALKPDARVRRVSFSYQENKDGSKDVINCFTETACLTLSAEVPRNGGQRLTVATVHSESVPIQVNVVRSEIFYPFDEALFRLSLTGCVNRGVEDCPSVNRLYFRTAALEYSDPDFILVDDGDNFFIERGYFVRLVSVIFLVISVVFLRYLITLSEPKDLLAKSLGLFGALWGLRSLLVPSTVKVFPTLIDYVILSQFCMLFTIIIVRVSMPSEEGERTA